MTRDEIITIRFALATTVQNLEEKLLPTLEHTPQDQGLYGQLIRTLDIAKKLQERFDRVSNAGGM